MQIGGTTGVSTKKALNDTVPEMENKASAERFHHKRVNSNNSTLLLNNQHDF